MNELAVYEKNLTQALNCPKTMRRRLLDRTRGMVQDFLAGKPDAGWDEVADFLGDPQELAQTMLETADQEMLERYRKRKLWLKRGLVAAVIAALLGSSIYFYSTRLNVTVERTMVIYETED